VKQIFDLFVSLNASDEQLSYPTLYASAREGAHYDAHDIAAPTPGGDRHIIISK
jgi:predicted membrane GTPase involved in stress response